MTARLGSGGHHDRNHGADRRRLAQAIAAPKNEPYRTTERKQRPDGSEYEVEIRLEVLRSAEPNAPARIVLTQRELEDA